MEHQSHRQLLGQQMNAVHILITRLYHVTVAQAQYDRRAESVARNGLGDHKTK